MRFKPRCPPAENWHHGHVACSLRLEDMSPVVVGNQILRLFRAREGVAITKVSPPKYTMKVAACLDGFLPCEFKVYVYRQGDKGQNGKAAFVEFQRRRGDGVAFAHICQEIFAKLKPDTQQLQAGFQVPPPCVLPRSTVALHVTPLLDMAKNACHSETQVEIVSGLRQAVEDSDLGSALCTPDFLDPLRRLLLAENFCIAYPTARMLHGIAKHRDVAQRFLSEVHIELCEIAETIYAKLNDVAINSDVAVLLAKALHQFVQHCPQDVPKQHVKLAASIKKFLEQEADAHVDHIRSCLRETLRACR